MANLSHYSAKGCKLLPTHGVEIIEHFVDSDQLIVEFIVSGGVRQERVTVRDEEIQNLYHLHSNSKREMVDTPVHVHEVKGEEICMWGLLTSSETRKMLNLGSR